MTDEQKQNADREYRNFATMASWNAFLDKEQVNYIFQSHGNNIYCHGRLRTIIAEPLTNDSFKLYSIPF